MNELILPLIFWSVPWQNIAVQNRAALFSILELLISFDVTSYFIVHFQKIVKFLKTSCKRCFFFFSSRLCVPKSWQGEALCSVFVGIFLCPSETWFRPSILIFLVFCFLPSSNDSTLTMHVKNSTKNYFYVMAGSETTLFCNFHPCFQLPAEMYHAYSTG